MDDAKDQIRQMVEAHVRPERSKRYGLSRNGILLYGPRRTGKTLLARATAGEFDLDQAATYAFADNRKITSADLYRALNEGGGKDRPQLERVEWDQVVIDESVKQDIQSLTRLLENGAKTREMGLEVPSGLLLIGPPGTGKSLIARLIASQTKRSFYPVSAANVLGSGVGDSVKRIVTLFSRAKEHSPAIIFLDEMDGLLPANNRNLSQHDIQVVEQFLTEISELKSQNEVFLIGTTNHPENIDSRVLRGGRFSEKIAILLPRVEQRAQLLKIFLNGTRLDTGLGLDEIAGNLDGASSADLQAICIAAKRMAFNRLTDGDQLPPLNRSDFDRAAQRVLGSNTEADNTFRSSF